MARNVNLIDEFLFSDGRRRLSRDTRSERAVITNAIERQVLRQVKPRLTRILYQVVDDIRSVYRRSGRAYNIMRYGGGTRVTGTTFRNLRVRIVGPEYIRSLDQGAKIRPVKSKYLAIPLSPQFGGEGARADGSPRLPGPRSWANIRKTYTFKSKAGNLYLAYNKKGQGPRGGSRRVLLYALVKLVEITGNNKLTRAYERRRLQMENILTSAIQQAFFDYVDNPKRHLLPIAGITTGGGRRTR